MSTYTHNTAPTQFIDAAGITFAYRRFGKKQGLPLVFFQHFTGNLDNWDPAVTDALATGREVILFDNAGVSSSTGAVAETIAGIAATALSFIDALHLTKVDLLGFSMGSFVAQQITIERPQLVNRLILIGSAPQGGEGIDTFSQEVWDILAKEFNPADELLLETFFSPTESSQRAGHSFLDRIRSRTADRDIAINDLVIPAQLAAIAEWGAPRQNAYQYLKNILHPVLVVGGKTDIIFPTINSYILQQYLPNAELVIYPDSGHGHIYQFPELFINRANAFLNGENL
jgi:pimeloyl-ACP methyl ester carboxylesterase